MSSLLDAYPTQTALKNAIRQVVNTQPFDTPFESELISDLITERHYFCSLKGLRPKRFKKTDETKPYRFYGDFPLIGWHSVSWVKSLSAPPSKQKLLADALRLRVEPEIIKFRAAHPVCKHCKTAASVEVHHADPSFATILDQVWSLLSDEDVEAALADWDWFKEERFTIGNKTVVMQLFDDLHSVARLEALCKNCHNVTKRKKPAA